MPELMHYNILDTLGKAQTIKNARTNNEINRQNLDWAREDRPGNVEASKTAARKSQIEIKGMEKDNETKDLQMRQVRLKAARDQLPSVERDTYDDYLDWAQNTIGLDMSTARSVEEVQSMTPEQFESYRKSLIMDADAVINMDLEQFKAEIGSKLESQKQRGRASLQEQGDAAAMERLKEEEKGKAARGEGSGGGADKEPWQDKIKREELKELRQRYRSARDSRNKVIAGVDIMGISDEQNKSLDDWDKELRVIEEEYENKGGKKSELGAGEGSNEVVWKINPETGKLENAK